ncbi:MAG: hypothetical protein DMG04_25935 [Acidobacteria bacterium]|nr:MAG: hypothetical protein DMG04_25935 [Acidobacteriota bacterium]
MVRQISEEQRAPDCTVTLDTTSGLRHIVEYAQDLIYYCDLEGYFTYVNPAGARVMGYDERELVGRHFVNFVHPDYRAVAVEFYRQQIEQGTPSTYLEFVAAKKDGTLIWIGQHVQLVYEDGRLSGVHGIARDITHQKSIEEKLRRSEASYRSLIHGAAYGIYRATLAGTILDANPALARMLGYDSAADLMSRRMTDLYQRPEDRDAVIARFGRFGEHASADLRWKRKDGSPILVHVSARAIELEDGGTGFEGIAEDITERRALEDQLRRAQRMEAIARLARGIAHDFNNVLAAIIGSGDLMELELHEDDPARAEATEIRKAAERGAALTHQLLAFARSQALTPQVIDLDAAVPRTLTMRSRPRHGRRRAAIALSRSARRRVRVHSRARHRRRDGCRDAGGALRTVLHAKRSVERNRPRSVDRLRHREGRRRDGGVHERAGTRHRVRGHPAVDRTPVRPPHVSGS